MKPENKAMRDKEPEIPKDIQKLIDEHVDHRPPTVYRRCEPKKKRK